jgi:hypothetical protein
MWGLPLVDDDRAKFWSADGMWVNKWPALRKKWPLGCQRRLTVRRGPVTDKPADIVHIDDVGPAVVVEEKQSGSRMSEIGDELVPFMPQVEER